MKLCVFVMFVHFGLARNVQETTLNPVATTAKIESSSISKYEAGLEDYDEAVESTRKSRGMMSMEDSYEHDHHPMPMKSEQKAVKTDPWAGYYDFLINEGSFKFWAVFQLGTALLLTYSAFAAVYYAKFNPIGSDYEYYDDFFFRSNGRSLNAPNNNNSWTNWFGMDKKTFQTIIDAITSKKYT